MIENSFNHPPGWNFADELLATLWSTPAPLKLLAEDFNASFDMIRGAIREIDGVLIERHGMTMMVVVASWARQPIRERCERYWQQVYSREAVAA